MSGCTGTRAPGEETGGRAAPPPRHDARSLTGGGQLAVIELDGTPYTLRITRQGKLILTK